MTHHPPVAQVFIGYDPRERVAVNVLTDSIQAHASLPVQIAQVRLEQLGSVYQRPQDPLQSTAFSFSRFLVPYLMGYECWALRDESKAVQVVQHQHQCEAGQKFQGMPQTPYRRKNWSSVMLFNCSSCTALTPTYVNTASGLELHQFHWLKDAEIGALPAEWNVLLDVQSIPPEAKILHYTLGGPWFDDCLNCAEADRWSEGHQLLNAPLHPPLAIAR